MSWRKWWYFSNQTIQVWIDWLDAHTRRRWQFRNKIKQYQAQSLLEGRQLPSPTPWKALYSYDKLIAEIGTGHGETLRHLAQHNRNILAVGFEWKKKFARVSARCVKNLPNAKMVYGQAYDLLPKLFARESINELYILFPDPWHKKKHHKRRPLNATFFTQVWKYLKPGATILIATDWSDYFDYIREAISQLPPQRYDYSIGDDYLPERFGLVPTHYYLKWRKQKRTFYWITLRKAL